MSKIINFDKVAHLSREFILSQVSEQDIFEHYINEPIKYNKLIKSPLREGDGTPSFNIFKSYNGLRFKDFGGKRGDCFQYICYLYNCSYIEAMKIIAKDMGIINGEKTTIIKDNKINPVEEFIDNFQKTIITVKRPFNHIDYNYWNRFNIPLTYLVEDRSYACQYVYLKNKPDNMYLWGEYKDNNPIYCYEVSNKHKVYRPLNPIKLGKWMGTLTSWDILGMEQLPKKGELLIITSSMKDRWVLKRLGYTAIAPPSESTIIPEKIMDFLWASFDNIVIFYDNDQPGIDYANKMIELYPGLSGVYIPNTYPEKDIAEFIETYKLEETKKLVKKLL